MRDHLRGRIDRPASLASVAATALVLGHSITYVLAVGQTRARDVLLAATGHGYWLVAVRVALVLAVGTVGSVFVRAVANRTNRSTLMAAGPAATALSLAAMQVVGYTIMELTERLLVGAPLSTLLVHDVFLLGIAIQVGLAGLAALALRWLTTTAERLVEGVVPGPAFVAGAIATIRAQVTEMRTSFAATPRSTRAPPRAVAVGAAR